MIIKSYAKLNLYLAVLNKRKDNYHNIETIFERISLCDEIALTPRLDGKIRLICNDPAVPVDSSNLCYKSARLLQEKFGLKRGVDIKIKKRIPAGAGLGGGSSNAACVLAGLNRLWKLGLSKGKLARLGGKIGADVPFFIYDTPFAVGTGCGDRIKVLKALKTTRLWHVLATPRFAVSTPRIYKEWDRCLKRAIQGLTKPESNAKLISLALKQNRLFQAGELIYNSLEFVTVRLYPEVKRIEEDLFRSGAELVRMSGSGPTVFSVHKRPKDAKNLAARIKRLDKTRRVCVAVTC